MAKLTFALEKEKEPLFLIRMAEEIAAILRAQA